MFINNFRKVKDEVKDFCSTSMFDTQMSGSLLHSCIAFELMMLVEVFLDRSEKFPFSAR